MPVFLFNALFKEDNITNPESQKTGIEIINPIMFIAKGDLLTGILFNIFSAITLVPPLFSKKIPIVVPNAIINPILDNVFPNPSEIDFTISFESKPNKKPTAIEAIINEKTGCTLNLTVAIMIRINAINKIIIISI